MAGGGGRPAAGQYKVLERRKSRVEGIELRLKTQNVGGGNDTVTGNAQFAAEIEKIMLHFEKAVFYFGRQIRFNLGQGIPLVSVSRMMNLVELMYARASVFPRPSWNAIFTKAHAKVAVEIGISENAVLLAKSRVLRRLRQEAGAFLS